MTKEMIQVFNNAEFGQVRTVAIDGEPWLVGKDVAEALGYVDAFGALKKHVDDEDKQNCQNDSFESNRGMTIINESGVYALVFGSKLESAKRFKHWVTSEVLPAIRKNGSYQLPDFSNPVEAARAWADAKEAEQLAAAEVKKLAPKAEAYHEIVEADGAVGLRDMAHMVRYNPNKIGKLCIELGLVYKKQDGKYYPKAKAIRDGLVVGRWKSTGWGNKGYMSTLYTIEGVNYVRMKINELGLRYC